ncbi:MAG: hypothetical protein WC635_10890 [Bacteriovorax sp.]|jgi:hypothetical protein
MKNLFLASLLLMSGNVFASKLANIKTLTNPVLEESSKELAGMDMITHSGSKKVLELKGKGNSAQEIRSGAVAQAMHTLCPFFDDGVAVGINTKDENGTLNAVADLTDSTNTTEGDADYKALVRSIGAANKQNNVEVYSGSASGNNTVGTVLGFYDIKNNEIAVFASTNCGSDD